TFSEARITAAAPSLGGLTSTLLPGSQMGSDLITSSTVILAPSCAQGWSTALPLFFTATSAISSSLIPYLCMYRLIFSENIQSKVVPRGRSSIWSKILQKAYCGCGCKGDIFSSATQRHVSYIPDATFHQPPIGVKTPVPPPT